MGTQYQPNLRPTHISINGLVHLMFGGTPFGGKKGFSCLCTGI